METSTGGTINKILHDLYYVKKSKAYYAGINQLYEHARLIDNKIKRKDVILWLRNQEAHIRHNPIIKTKKFDTIRAIAPFSHVQVSYISGLVHFVVD
jgi:hypothetical protein